MGTLPLRRTATHKFELLQTLGKEKVSALTKAKMADQLFDELGLNKREAKEIVELFFSEVSNSLEKNVQVKLSGFGNFDLRKKGEGQDATQRLAKRYRSPRGAWLRFDPARNSKRGLRSMPVIRKSQRLSAKVC